MNLNDLATKADLQEMRAVLLQELINLIKPIQMPTILKATEVMALLKIDKKTLQNLRISGELSAKKIGGTYYFNAFEIQSRLPKNP